MSDAYLRRRDDGECVHDSVWVFLTDLGDEECAHTGAGTATQGVCELEALEAITALGFLADYVQDGVDELSALCVMSLGPVVTSARLAEHEIVWSEDLAERSGSDGVHGSWFQINQTGAGYVFAA